MVKDEKWSLEYFLEVRKEVLSSYKTGSDPLLDLNTSIEYLKSVPDHKNFPKKLIEAKKNKETLIQPRAGVPVIEEHIKLLNFLEKAGADFLPTTIDSYTRLNRYDEAEKGIEISKEQNRAFLNGFPAVNHGVANCRKVLESVNLPLQARHGTPDSRLLAEIIHASGWTSNEGGAISYNVPYAKNVSIEDSIFFWQYCDRLVGFYEDNGVSINREPFGPLTGTLVPPCIVIAVGLIETLLAARQGVKNITVGYGQLGNITQDVAGVKVLEKLTKYYLDKAGFKDMFITTVFHQWMGGFPENETEALSLISYASTVAALSGATKMITKTSLESIGIPTKEANAQGIKISKFITRLLKDQSYPNSEELQREMKQLETEVHALMDAVYKAGKGDLARGTVNAFRDGLLDVPFAPSRFNANKVLPARDHLGYVRILDFGNLPFNDEIKKFHREKLEERAKEENREVSFQMTVDDIYAVSKGALVGKPEHSK